ncbi:hypothetical protein GDO86_004310 [Hymenochirus boettgeri]|uniref:Coiled-coil domain-containing protein 89 n=1 Tax=Hymenochirus boettgeri TaxID=247094 RepID=A0A8T2KD00_9PIPI|nr:hypothetical protein GDO86_004310 [Hymenochirus boettgeri]
MLRSRLEEQSQLICMLKRRADETLVKCQIVERTNEDLENRNRDAARQLQAEKERADLTEQRFDLLAANHEQMIQFKDEYKEQNERLRERCQDLLESKFPELLERDRLILELRSRVGELEQRLRETELDYGHHLDTLRGNEEKVEKKNWSQTLELESLTNRLKDSEMMCCQIQTKLSDLESISRNQKDELYRKVEELKKEKQDLVNLCMERGKIIQECKKEASDLSVQVQEAENQRMKAEERYQIDKAAVDADARIRDLQRKLEAGENQFEQLGRDFEAYKKHSGDLLAKERDLNSKLRHLIG